MIRKTLRNLVMNEPSLLLVGRDSCCGMGEEVAGNGEVIAVLPRDFRCVERGFREECATKGSSKVVGGGDVGASSRLFSAMEDSEGDEAVTLEGDEVSKDSTSVDGVDCVELRAVCPLTVFAG